jgi:hypothetical protein
MQFRKKPVVIEAMMFEGLSTAAEIVEWSGGLAGLKERSFGDPMILLIPTLEGIMQASVGDWIIKGVKGEFYPCKPDIFESTYDPVD